MTKKKNKFRSGFRRILPYLLTGIGVVGLVFVGSIDKKNQGINLSLSSFAQDDYSDVSIDQMSELYMVADLSDALGLASAQDVASNFVITTTMYDSGQTSTTGKLEKPSLTDVDASRGVIEHTVAEGENVEVLAAKYGVSADQIRWSNNLKTNEVGIGTVLYIPSTSGIVYTVKSGDTIESIVSKYGSSVEEIVALNDLEVSGISDGMRIVIHDGSLPETERPEYVAPARTTYNYSNTAYSYTYLGNTSERQNISIVGYYNIGGGQCVDWAGYMRPDLGALLLGNANAWARNAAAHGYTVDRTPSAGSIFQTSSGWYGHVGYVEGVNSDGSITVTEMNYNYRAYQVIRATIPASAVGNFNYIH